jgi:hypothetical protein
LYSLLFNCLKYTRNKKEKKNKEKERRKISKDGERSPTQSIPPVGGGGFVFGELKRVFAPNGVIRVKGHQDNQKA